METTHSAASQRIRDALEGFRPDPQSPYGETAQKAVFLARRLQRRACRLQSAVQRRRQAELDRMIRSPEDKATLIQWTDQAFRSQEPRRAVGQLAYILSAHGIPRFFRRLDRMLLEGFRHFGPWLPGAALPLVRRKMRRETSDVILPAESPALARRLERRRREGVRMNVNFLGEALLGQREAENRLRTYLEALRSPEIEVISVKISTIDSQISPLARRRTTDRLRQRLERLFREAAQQQFVRAGGALTPKFVYLDMEEYRDMSLTADAFMQALDQEELQQVSAGIALQAYLSDSYRVQCELTDWARRRVAHGGSPITLRLVKGANMEMERIEASQRGWAQAPYKTKRRTDANFKRMLQQGLRPENLQAVRIGIASHNLFEIAHALVLALQNDALEQVQFEMLEGMADHQRRALFELTDDMLLYAPACRKEDFVHAIGYLVRRFDENSGPQNFLRHAFGLQVGSDDWVRLEQDFLQSFDEIDQLSNAPRRTQDRRQIGGTRAQGAAPEAGPFVNEPDTDFSLPQNGEWAERIVADWLPRCDQHAADIPLVLAGREVADGRTVRECLDPSRPGVVVGRYRQAAEEDIDRAVACAQGDEDGWRAMPPSQRSDILRAAAQEIRNARAELIGAALLDGGKTIAESDPEVSEAVDFVEFYRRAAQSFHDLAGVEARGRGVVVVVSPWNFPIAIPCGGVAAALAAGNTVILKPASDTVLVAYRLCRCFWKAGVSKKTLQFAPCPGGELGARLASHPDVHVVILTGGTQTALDMLRRRPEMDLLAETGGKNATIVTAMADREQAIQHVAHSALSHSGQKCSATSLLILEREVYRDPKFRRSLCDAIESLPVGPAYELDTRVGPLIRPPGGPLQRALNELEPGESWAVRPRIDDDNPQLVSPGVKWGVQPGGFTHQTELFGPVLGVMEADNLEHAIRLANDTGYGLTAGLESLDDREQQLWARSLRAGNLYINRVTTGAVVLRQPFGGMRKSAFGPGIKAGGPNYVAPLMTFRETSPHHDDADTDNTQLAALLQELKRWGDAAPDDLRSQVKDVLSAARSYARWRREEFACEHDHFRLLGQDNLRRYLPVENLRIRLHPKDSLFELLARLCAARTMGCRVTVSSPPGLDGPTMPLLARLASPPLAAIEHIEESDEQLAQAVLDRRTDRLRYAAAARVPSIVRRAAPEVQLFIADQRVLRHGRIELLWYVREQSLSVDYHRHGNLVRRAGEPRSEPL